MDQFQHFQQFINLNDMNQMNNNDLNDITEKLFNLEVNETDKIYAKNLSGQLYDKIYTDLANILKSDNKLEDNEYNNDYYCISKFIQFYEDASKNIIIENFNDLVFVETKKFKK